MARDPMINTVTGERRVIRKKSDLIGAGKGDWLRIDVFDKEYIKNYNRIFGKKNTLVENKMVAAEEPDEKSDRKD